MPTRVGRGSPVRGFRTADRVGRKEPDRSRAGRAGHPLIEHQAKPGTARGAFAHPAPPHARADAIDAPHARAEAIDGGVTRIRLELASGPAAAAGARQALRALRDRLEHALYQDLVLLVSELVTN